MRNIKTYEIFGGSRITNSLKKDIKKFSEKLTDFMLSIINGDMKIFNELIDSVNLEDVEFEGNTSLLLASSNGRLKMLKELLKRGANIHHKNDRGEDFYDLAKFRYKFINSIKDYIEKEYPEFIAAKKYNL